MSALAGAICLLRDSEAIEVELSLIPLYEGGASWRQVIDLLAEDGMHLCDIERVWYDAASGDLLQINGLFRRAVT